MSTTQAARFFWLSQYCIVRRTGNTYNRVIRKWLLYAGPGLLPDVRPPAGASAPQEVRVATDHQLHSASESGTDKSMNDGTSYQGLNANEEIISDNAAEIR